MPSPPAGMAVPEVAEWGVTEPIREEKLAALDVVPLCIKIVSYGQPPKNIWANRTYLQLTGSSLESFRAQVQFSLLHQCLPWYSCIFQVNHLEQCCDNLRCGCCQWTACALQGAR